MFVWRIMQVRSLYAFWPFEYVAPHLAVENPIFCRKPHQSILRIYKIFFNQFQKPGINMAPIVRGPKVRVSPGRE
jgi:hypothetical protein